MKLFVMLFFITSLSLNSYASKNPYAPTLKEVVVLYDVADKEFFPFFFHLLLGETFMMSMSEDCPHVKVTTQNDLYCYTNSKETRVGKLSKAVNQNGFETAYKIDWFSNVKIKETRNKNNTGYLYSLVLKK